MRRPALRCLGIVLAASGAWLWGPELSRADDAETAKARAKKLFEQGTAAIEKKDFDTGCKAMRESLALFVVANSLFQVAMCDEREMKLASALAYWKRGWALVDKSDPRSKVAAKKIEGLEKRVPRVKIAAPGNILPIVILIDDVEVSSDELEGPVAVDPGRHVVTTRKQGYQDKQFYVLVDEAQRTEVQVALGAPLPEKNVPEKNESASSSPGAKLRIAAFVSLGIGAVGVIGGAVTSGIIVANDSKIDDSCVEKSCDPKVKDVVEQQRALLPVNTTAWVVGALGVSAAAILFPLAAKVSSTEKPAVGLVPIPIPRGVGIGVFGRF